MVNGAQKGASDGGPQDNLVELTFHVPELQQRPAVGAGCCALPAEFLIEESLNEAERVHRVVVSDEEGLVRVWVSKGDLRLVEDLKDCIEALGYHVVESLPASS